MSASLAGHHYPRVSPWWDETDHFAVTADGVLYGLFPDPDPDLADDDDDGPTLVRLGDLVASDTAAAVPPEYWYEFRGLRAEWRAGPSRRELEREWSGVYLAGQSSRYGW